VSHDEAPGRVARNVARIRISAIKEMAMLSARTEGAVSLAWGLPSFPTPEPIREAVREALASDPDVGKYALPDGLPELRELVARHHLRETGVAVDPDREVLITAGNMQGLNALFHVLLDPGDEVVVTSPGFASHFQQIRLCGGEPVHWPLLEADGWQLDTDGLEPLITRRSKAVVIVSPSNPTGKIFTREELLRVGEIARRRGLMVLIDDPYRYFTYENESRYFNLSSARAHLDHTAYLFTFSKTFAMSGWRLGYMILPAELKASALKVHDATLICAPRISQVAGIAALRQRPDHLSEFEGILGRRRELICARLDRVPHVFSYQRPEGAYYVFPRIVAEHFDSVGFARDLLSRAGVAVTPGSAFGPAGEHHVRMAFCVSEAEIDLAFDRIESRFGAAG
jgi:aminotransferase